MSTEYITQREEAANKHCDTKGALNTRYFNKKYFKAGADWHHTLSLPIIKSLEAWVEYEESEIKKHGPYMSSSPLLELIASAKEAIRNYKGIK